MTRIVVPRTAALLLLLAIGFSGTLQAQPRVELYTMGLGDDLFSKFGHAALCITGEGLPGGGTCYNYGTSDFSRPLGLSWEVVRGRAEFWVSVSDLTTMLLSFQGEDRTIYRQVLPLDADRVMEMARELYRDAAPENRVYVYNHFLENCSTRPRDHIDRVTDGQLRAVKLSHVGTYRDYALEGFSSFSWALVPAGDFIMGKWVDRKITSYDAMFIPRVLREGVETAFGARADIVYQREAPLSPIDVAGALRATWIAFAGFLVAFGVFARFGSPRGARILGGVLLGGLGTLLLLAALVSVLPELRRNELLLVFFPLDFVLLSRNPAFVSSYSTMRLLVLLLVAVLAFTSVLVQPLWPFWFLSAGTLGVVRAVLRRE